MCLLGMGAVLNVEVSSVRGGGVGECRRGCSRVMVAIFTKAVVIPTRGDRASPELISDTFTGDVSNRERLTRMVVATSPSRWQSIAIGQWS